MKNCGYNTHAHIHSLGGDMDEVFILDELQEEGQTVYVVDYKGTKCTAIFNPFVCQFYVDDKYGIIKEN
ncbi:MAG: hypothetical protein IKM18_00260 [Clostridia bacterium]|nr:hypothetical protein [Clostridia bacterium]